MTLATEFARVLPHETQCNSKQTWFKFKLTRHRYTKVLDNRKHPIRGLWRRNGKFVARITVEDDAGRKAVKWVPLEAQTTAEAQEEFRTLLVERGEDRLRHIGRCPKFSDYVEQTYENRLATSGKKPDTMVTEHVHLKQLRESVGHLSLDKIRPYHVIGHLQKLKQSGKANRTCNLALVVLRNVLKNAKIDGFIKTLPVDGIPWQRSEKKARRLYTRQDVDLFCEAALTASKNGAEFADYVRLLALCGAREQETIKVRWADVDFEHKLLTRQYPGAIVITSTAASAVTGWTHWKSITTCPAESKVR
jgi:integrase